MLNNFQVSYVLNSLQIQHEHEEIFHFHDIIKDMEIGKSNKIKGTY